MENLCVALLKHKGAEHAGQTHHTAAKPQKSEKLS